MGAKEPSGRGRSASVGGTEGLVFSLLGPLGFRALGWTGEYDGRQAWGLWGLSALEDGPRLAASLAPVRKDDSTKAIFDRISKNPSTTASLGNLPNITFTPGGNGWAGGAITLSNNLSNKKLFIRVGGTGVASEALSELPIASPLVWM